MNELTRPEPGDSAQVSSKMARGCKAGGPRGGPHGQLSQCYQANAENEFEPKDNRPRTQARARAMSQKCAARHRYAVRKAGDRQAAWFDGS